LKNEDADQVVQRYYKELRGQLLADSALLDAPPSNAFVLKLVSSLLDDLSSTSTKDNAWKSWMQKVMCVYLVFCSP
jgi:hypothetical protein